MRRLKQQQSGVGGTGNFTEGTETDNNESCAPPRNDDRFSFTLSAQGGTQIRPSESENETIGEAPKFGLDVTNQRSAPLALL